MRCVVCITLKNSLWLHYIYTVQNDLFTALVMFINMLVVLSMPMNCFLLMC